MKSGLDWFRLDVAFEDNFELVVAEFGAKGFETLIRLYQKIYQEGYYCQWNRDVALLFSRKVRLGVDAVEEIVRAGIRRNLFDAELFKKHSILTSHGIQKWYFDCAGRRTGVKVIKEFLLLNDAEIKGNVNISSENVSRNMKNVSNFQHSTVQNSTGQNRESCAPSLKEIRAFCEERKSTVDPKRFFDYFDASGWVDSRGNKVRNWKQKVISWEQGDFGNNRQKQSDPKHNVIPKDLSADELNAAYDEQNESLIEGESEKCHP